MVGRQIAFGLSAATLDGTASSPTTTAQHLLTVLWDTLPAPIERHLNQLWRGTCRLDLSSSADGAQ